MIRHGLRRYEQRRRDLATRHSVCGQRCHLAFTAGESGGTGAMQQGGGASSFAQFDRGGQALSRGRRGATVSNSSVLDRRLVRGFRGKQMRTNPFKQLSSTVERGRVARRERG